MLALPCCRRCGSADCGDEGAGGAFPAGSVAVQGGGGACSMSAMDLEAFSRGRLRPRGGDRRRGTVRLLRAAKMRRKTSGSAAGGSAGGGKGCSVGWGAGGAGESRGVGSALGGLASGWALSGAGLELSPAVGGGRTGQHPPLPAVLILHSQPSPGHSGDQAWGALGI